MLTSLVNIADIKLNTLQTLLLFFKSPLPLFLKKYTYFEKQVIHTTETHFVNPDLISYVIVLLLDTTLMSTKMVDMVEILKNHGIVGKMSKSGSRIIII